MKPVHGFVVALAVAAALAHVPAPLDAQRGPPGRSDRPDRAELERRVRARFAEVVRERLGLDEEGARRLSDVLGDFEEERRALRAEESALRRRADAFAGEGAEDEVEARALLERMEELRRDESALFEREQAALLEVLTPAQVVRLHTLRLELVRRIRRMRGPPGRRPSGHVHPPGSVDSLRSPLDPAPTSTSGLRPSVDPPRGEI